MLFRTIVGDAAEASMKSVLYNLTTDGCEIESLQNETHFVYHGYLEGKDGESNDVISRQKSIHVPFRNHFYRSYLTP